MIGGIYSDEKCQRCGASFRDNGRNALICPEHPEERARSFKVKFKKIYKRFRTYEEAGRFLVGLRFKMDEGTFDGRDYRRDNQLKLESCVSRFLERKKETVSHKTYMNLKNFLYQAVDFFGDIDIRGIGYGEIEDFLISRKVGDKTKSEIRSALHSLFGWLHKRKEISEVPEMPDVKFSLNIRKRTDTVTQVAILDEIRRIAPFKVWLAILWLKTYISVRPGEMITLLEGDIDLGMRTFLIRRPKERKPKIVPIIDEDVEILNALPRSMPQLYFFRHEDGSKFGPSLLYKTWKRACKNLGVDGVDLYGGTRHSSATALRGKHSPEQIRVGTQHGTNKAFDRYCVSDLEEMREIYSDTRLTPAVSDRSRGQVIDITGKKMVGATGFEPATL